MPNLVVGLKYQPPHDKVETEQQLMKVFSDLKEQYSRLNSQFRITSQSGQPIETFRQFLDVVTGETPSVVLTGSGDVDGLVVNNASLEYDLSTVTPLTRYWDQYRDGSCHSCLDQIRVVCMNSYWDCDKQKPMRWKNCPTYNPKLKNENGEPARKLVELVEEATK